MTVPRYRWTKNMESGKKKKTARVVTAMEPRGSSHLGDMGDVRGRCTGRPVLWYRIGISHHLEAAPQWMLQFWGDCVKENWYWNWNYGHQCRYQQYFRTTYNRDKSPASPGLVIRQQIPPIQRLQCWTDDSSTSHVLLGGRCYYLRNAQRSDVSHGSTSQDTRCLPWDHSCILRGKVGIVLGTKQTGMVMWA